MTKPFICLLLAAMAVITTCIAVFAERRVDEVAATPREPLFFPSLAAALPEVAAIDVTRAAGRFTLTRAEGGWRNEGLAGYPAISDRADDVLAKLAGLRRVAPRTARARLYRRLGVEDVAEGATSTRLTLHNAGGEVLADLIVGAAQRNGVQRSTPGTYVRMPDAARVWLAYGSFDVHHDAANWSERRLVDIAPDAVMALEVVHPDGDRIQVVRDGSADGALTMAAGDRRRIARPGQLQYLAALFESLEFLDALPEERLRDRRGDQPPGVQAAVLTRDGVLVELRQLAPAERDRVWAELNARAVEDGSPEAVERARAIAAAVAGWVYLLPQSVTERLRLRADNVAEATGG